MTKPTPRVFRGLSCLAVFFGQESVYLPDETYGFLGFLSGNQSWCAGWWQLIFFLFVIPILGEMIQFH